jgi:hypothetical protein
MLRRMTVAVATFVLPSPLARLALRAMGFSVGRDVRIGLSLLLVDRLHLGDGCRIGHFNLINVRRLLCDSRSQIGRGNIMNGPLAVRLMEQASLGNRNKVLRGPSPAVVAWGSQLRLERASRLTSDHLLDCTRSIRIGEYSILAGSGSQVWTHGYVHSQQGPGRYRVDGPVNIGSNVYIGSRCIINLSVDIASGCSIGAGSVISKSLTSPGLYVGMGLRQLPIPGNPLARADLQQQLSPTLCEAVFLKKHRGFKPSSHS